MKIDIIFPVFNRLEFTRASLTALLLNTDWERVGNLLIYDDNSSDGTMALVELPSVMKQPLARCGAKIKQFRGGFGGPVAITNHYLRHFNAALFAKVDNDIAVPKGWLESCQAVMEAHPELGLLGIESLFVEAHAPYEPDEAVRSYQPAEHIGGIGLFRRSVFTSLPQADGRGGFTQWQQAQPELIKGWLDPDLPVVLLDKLPHEPWASLSERYMAAGWQRDWGKYPRELSWLWEWFDPKF